MQDLGPPVAYSALTDGTPVYDRNGERVGVVEHVLADLDLDSTVYPDAGEESGGDTPRGPSASGLGLDQWPSLTHWRPTKTESGRTNVGSSRRPALDLQDQRHEEGGHGVVKASYT